MLYRMGVRQYHMKLRNFKDFSESMIDVLNRKSFFFIRCGLKGSVLQLLRAIFVPAKYLRSS